MPTTLGCDWRFENEVMTSQLGSDWEDIQDQKYPGYGRCIYCGSDGGVEGLREEHIIPYSLGGNTVIEAASCRDCERRISPVDHHLGKTVFEEYRIHADVQTRHPKDRPTSLPAQFTVNGQPLTMDLPIKDHPFAMAMPVWGDAGFFRSAPIDEPFPETKVNLYNYMPPNMRDALGLTETDDFKVWSQGRVNGTLFARGIAKIAYCHMIIKYGLDGFNPLALVDIILGRFSGVSYFVGTPLRIPSPPFAKGQRHAIQISDLDGGTSHEKLLGMGLKLHVVRIRLFADSACGQHGLPVYHVIGGVRRPQRIARRPFLDTPKRIYL